MVKLAEIHDFSIIGFVLWTFLSCAKLSSTGNVLKAPLIFVELMFFVVVVVYLFFPRVTASIFDVWQSVWLSGTGTDKQTHRSVILRLQTGPAALAAASVSNASKKKTRDAQKVSGSLSHIFGRNLSAIFWINTFKSPLKKNTIFCLFFFFFSLRNKSTCVASSTRGKMTAAKMITN